MIIPFLPVLRVQTHIRSVRGEALSRASEEESSLISCPLGATGRPNRCTATNHFINLDQYRNPALEFHRQNSPYKFWHESHQRKEWEERRK